MQRRRFLTAGGAGGLLAYGGGLAWAQSGKPALPLLPRMDLTRGTDARIPLTLQSARHDFGTGAASETFGINSSYLGPVVRVKQGQTIPFDVRNGTAEVTTLHWHGLHIPGPVDGGRIRRSRRARPGPPICPSCKPPR